MSVVIHNSVR